MPTRYLKPGIRDSERIESLSCDAEILYYRLLVSVDDFGRMDARPLLVKSQCFPIRLRATADTCAAWMKELESAGLIVTYTVGGKPYLQFMKWENKARSQHSRCPDPTQMHTDVSGPLTLLPGTGTGTGTDIPSSADADEVSHSFDVFWAAYPKKVAKDDARKAWKKIKFQNGLFEKITSALDRAKKLPDWNKENGQYIPHAATWLNKKRWQDELPKSTKQAFPL
jgi:hypothetical protein